MSFVSYILNGISLGSVYAIIALGYTMVYGIAKMLNFAHGDIIMVGSYVAFLAINSMGLPVPVAIVLSVIVCTVLGMVIDHSHRCKLFPAERSASAFWCQYQILHVCGWKCVCPAGRRFVSYSCNDRDSDSLCDHHDRTHGIYEIFQSRSCYAGSI